MFSLPTVALSIFLKIFVENWSFPDHKSDFKADQKIRKAMFSGEKRSFGISKEIRGETVFSRLFPPVAREQVSFLFSTLLAVNPSTLVPNVPI